MFEEIKSLLNAIKKGFAKYDAWFEANRALGNMIFCLFQLCMLVVNACLGNMFMIIFCAVFTVFHGFFWGYNEGLKESEE